MKRRSLLSAAPAVFFGSALPLKSSLAQDKYSKFKGQTIKFNVPKHTHFDAAKKIIPEFTKLTGINVELIENTFAEMSKLHEQDMKKSSSDYDLITYINIWRPRYVKENYLTKLEEFLRDPSLSDPTWGYSDFIGSYFSAVAMNASYERGANPSKLFIYGVPFGAETSVLAYRPDLLQKAGVSKPTNYTELLKALPTLRDKTGQTALSTRAAKGHQCVHAWLLHFHPMGGKFRNAQGTPTFDSAAGVASLDALKQIVQTGTKGNINFSQGEMLAQFLNGESAMYLDSTLIFGAAMGDKSKIKDKVAFALHPKGIEYASQTGGLGIGIPAKAKNAGAAFLLAQWLTSPAQDVSITMQGGVPARKATLANADVLKKYPMYQLLNEQVRHAVPYWRPMMPEWNDVSNVLGIEVHAALTGEKTSQKALSDAKAQVQSILG